MKKYYLVAALLVICGGLFAQKVSLNTNGHNLNFEKVDSLFYAEYPLGSTAKINAESNNGNNVNLKYSFGKIAKRKEDLLGNLPLFITSYYVYEDGTLQAPTTQIFFKPNDITRFKKLYYDMGIIEEHPSLKGYYYLYVTDKKYNTGESIFELCNRIYNDKSVEIIEPVFELQLKQQNPLRPWEWNIKNNGNVTGAIAGADMKVEQAWCVSTGTNVRVAVIDDGVDLTHPDLQANLLPGYDATGNNSGGAPTTTNSHGTNCAGIIASVDNTIGTVGVAFNSKIIPIRMGIVVNATFNTNPSWQAACFAEAVNRGADVISCSWGGGSQSVQLDAAITNAVTNGRGGKGCVVVFSSGNNNDVISYPSSNANVIAVGASTPCDSRKRSSSNILEVNPGVKVDLEGTSCDGERWWGSNFGAGIDVIAPGVLITTTDNVGANGAVAGDYSSNFNGTSAACPNAAAVLALIIAADNNLTGLQARNILEQTCFKIPNGNFQTNVAGQPNGTWSNQAGYGRVDAQQAVLQTVRNRMNIIGNTLICNTSDYFIANLSAGASVIWSQPSWGGSVLEFAQNTPIVNQLRITNRKWYGLNTTLTATINNIGGCASNSITLTKAIGNDNNTSSSAIFNYSQEACIAGGVSHPSQSGTTNGATFVHSGCLVTVAAGSDFGKTVTFTGAIQPLMWSTTSTGFIFQLPLNSGGIPFTFKISGVGACFDQQILFFAYSNNGRLNFTVSPNPVNNILSVKLVDEKFEPSNFKSTILKTKTPTIFNIYDVNTNTLQLTQKSYKGILRNQINTSLLKKGYYVLQIKYGDHIEAVKFFKE